MWIILEVQKIKNKIYKTTPFPDFIREIIYAGVWKITSKKMGLFKKKLWSHFIYINLVNKGAFKEAMKPVYDKWIKKLGEEFTTKFIEVTNELANLDTIHCI